MDDDAVSTSACGSKKGRGNRAGQFRRRGQHGAACMRALGRRKEALEWVEKAHALDPDDRISQMLRAELLQRFIPEG